MRIQRKKRMPKVARMLLYVFLIGSAVFLIMAVVEGATNISSVDKWAWSDAIGWIDFYSTDNVTVNSQQLIGYASSSAGEISLDCATAPGGSVCGTSPYKVTNDGLGSLSGWAWNDAYGWISFDCNNHGGCATPYRVVVDPNNGTFSNYAWNDVLGWISFNCSNHGGCGISYKVVTSWIATSTTGTLDSSTFDTGVAGGAKINSVLWRGDLPAQTAVRFQFATSNSSSGPWGFVGPDGTVSTYYAVGSDTAFPLSFSLHGDHRYFRYRAILVSDQAQRNSPRVDEVIVNWSP